MTTRATPRRLLFALMFAAAAAIVACGGDESAKQEAGVGAGGTGPGTASVGAITGFGSVYVNGIRFDDDAADIRTVDGARLERRQLNLGMWVEVLGSVNANGSTGRADLIRVVPAVRGVVSRVELLKNEFRVLGAKVQVNSSTVFGGAGTAAGLDSVRVGDLVDVYGAADDRDDGKGVEVEDRDDRVIATRVQRVGAGTPGQFSQRGRISAVTPATFKLGGLTVNTTAARLDGASSLADGLMVTVIAAVPPVSNVLNADRVIANPQVPADVQDVALDGVVNQFDSLESFRISDTRIDARQASITGGTRNDIVAGARLFVRGKMVEKKLVASEVTVLGATAPALPAIVLGPITEFESIREFEVRGAEVDASNATFINGSSASLAVGRTVEARGTIQDGKLRATQVTILP